MTNDQTRSKRLWIAIHFLAAASSLLVASAPSLAAAEDASLPPQLDAAIARGLAFLARQQNADGSFDGGGPRVATTGLTIMAFLASGHTPDAGPYGLPVRRAIDSLVAQAPADGYFGKADGSRMYGHGIATLALAESLGVQTSEVDRQKIETVLRRAVKVILDAQDVAKDDSNSGGWRYEPTSPDSDLSLSGWNALALRAATNVGLDVPPERVRRAVAYVLKCYNARPEQRGFAYQPGQDASAAMTGVGVLSLYLLDAADRPELTEATALLLNQPVDPQHTRYPYYAGYYVTQAAFQAGDPVWPRVWQMTSERLLAEQSPQDGGWPLSHSSEEPGRVYATSMAVLTLAVPYRLLPIYQR
jgi:hypothetical protein